MTSQSISGKIFTRLGRLLKSLPDLIKEFKGTILFAISWLIIGQLAGHSIIDLAIFTGKLIIYPLMLILFQTEFEALNVPEILLLLVPLLTLMSVGLTIIIITED